MLETFVPLKILFDMTQLCLLGKHGPLKLLNVFFPIITALVLFETFVFIVVFLKNCISRGNLNIRLFFIPIALLDARQLIPIIFFININL